MSLPDTPRPKPRSATDAYAEIRRRRDEICKAEGRKPLDPFDALRNESSSKNNDGLFIAFIADDYDELYRLYDFYAPVIDPHGIDLSEGAE